MSKVGRKIFIFSIIIVIIIIVFFFREENVLFTGLKPFQKFLYNISYKIENASNPVFGCKELKVYIKFLETKVNVLERENAQLKVIAQNDKILREHLNFFQKNKNKFVVANIIGQKYEAGINYFLIDRGKEDDLKDGLAIINKDGFFVGTIVKTKKSISYFIPIYDPHSQRAVDIISKNVTSTRLTKIDSTSGIMKGHFGTSAIIDWVPQDKMVRIGDIVTTSGLETNIPRGIIIGKVDDVVRTSNTLFQKIIVKPMFIPKNLRIVSVIIPNYETR